MIETYYGIKTIKHDFHTNAKFVNPICVIGMPGIADVGKFALDSLIGQLKAKLCLEIIFDEYPAGAIVDESILAAPKAEILLYKDPDELRDIFLITADAQSLTPRGIYRISNFLAETLAEFGVKLVIALGAFPVSSQNINSKIPKIYVTSTNPELLQNFLIDNNCLKIKKGVIIGANGLIPVVAKARYNIDGLVFLGETDNIAMINEDITDLRASITLLDMIKKSFDLPINNKYSLDNIEDITKNLQNKKEQLEKDLDTFKFVDNADDKRKSLYI